MYPPLRSKSPTAPPKTDTPRAMLLALIVSCSAPQTAADSAGIRTEVSVLSANALPQVAPGVVLLATLAADDSIAVGGTIQAELWVDIDDTDDERYPFRYRILDAAGNPIYARSTSGPVIVREFLAYYGELTGYQLLDLFPLLGTFAVTVPVLDEGVSVEFQLRDPKGNYDTVGNYDLSNAVNDDLGVSDAVAGVEVLHDGGDPQNALDIVIVPDGYQADELDSFARDAKEVCAVIMDMSPLADYSDAVNLYRIDVASVEHGASYDCDGTCEMRDTAFDSFFPLELVNRVIGSNYRTTAVFQLEQWEVARVASVVPWDLVVVIVNTPHDGGFAVHYSTVTNGMSDLAVTATHELSHVLGQLGDEYDEDDCVRSDTLGLPDNITDTPKSPPWSKWIADDTPLPTDSTNEYIDSVGAFAGAYNCGDLYRPQEHCLMRESGSHPALCAVCTELVTRRLFRFADPASGATAFAVAGGGYQFALQDVRSDASVEWKMDDEVVGSNDSLVLEPEDVPSGSHSLTAVATVNSPFVLDDHGDLHAEWAWEVW